MSYHILGPKYSSFTTNISTLEVPSNFHEAQNKEKRKEGIKEKN